MSFSCREEPKYTQRMLAPTARNLRPFRPSSPVELADDNSPTDRQTSQEKNHTAEPNTDCTVTSKYMVMVLRHSILRWFVRQQ